MSKKPLIFGSTALLIVALLILAGCPDVVDNPQISVPASVTLATGSQGTAGVGTVTGLVQTKSYLVQRVTGNGWYAVGATGAVGTRRETLEAAIADTPASLTTGTITGLENGLEYKVFLYQTGASGVPVTVDQKSSIIDISGLVSGNSINLTKSSAGGGSVIIYTGDTNTDGISKTAVAAGLDFGETAKKYALAAGAAGPGATIVAVPSEKFATLDLSGLTAPGLDITINVTAVAPVLASGSQGIAGDHKITVATGNKYVVYDETANKWYGVDDDGTLAGENATLVGSVFSASDSLTGTEIIGLTNGSTYNVFYYATGTASSTIDFTDSSSFNSKNGILNISGLGNSDEITLTKGPAGSAVYVYTGDVNKTGINVISPAGTIGSQVFGNTSLQYGLSNLAGTPGTIEAPEGAPYAILNLSGADEDFTVKITVSTAS
jgi:hypothetical protein